jgi:CheY-like chemotaxis protein
LVLSGEWQLSDQLSSSTVQLSKVLPDLVMSDYMMPSMNGLELRSAMQDNEAYHMIPFVLMSTHLEAAIRSGGVISGYEGFLAKPFDLEHICELVAQLTS